MAELEFFGAAQTVTGAMHVLHLPSGPVLLDCGLFQGRRQWAREMNETFPVPPKKVRAVLLSHAHIDHSGKIPQLFVHGFRGPIYATSATCDLCSLMLADSGHIQEEDARYWNEKRASSPEEMIEPLYTVEDARRAEGHFRCGAYNQPVEFAPGCTAKFLEAGHILGSAFVLVEIASDGGGPTRLLYTGDIGRSDMPILRDPVDPLPEADYLITESTYAHRRHEETGQMKVELSKVINETRALGGKVIIPAFSVGRTQHVVWALSRAMSEGLMEPLPVYVDSPLSVNVTEVFRKHTECYDAAASEVQEAVGDIFGNGRVTYITDVNESKALNYRDEPCVIISASGMCEAGRILHHLKNNITDERNTVVIVGYQAKYTLGRRLVERNPRVKIFGREYDRLARVKTLNGFSAHADADELARAVGPIAGKLKAAFVVHGENDQLNGMRDILADAGCPTVHIPERGDKFEL